jgi:hypothetical protein
MRQNFQSGSRFLGDPQYVDAASSNSKEAFMPSYATLDLGDPSDSVFWQKGCQSRGFTQADSGSILKQSPTLTELESFFRSQPDWVYFSGHISGTSLYAHTGDAQILFKRDGVAISKNALAIKYDETAINLLKKNSAFAMQKNCLLVVLGGCSAFASPSTVRIIRELFFNPIVLGYSDHTRSVVNAAMLGGGNIRSHFFANVQNGENLVDAWLHSGLEGYGGTSKESMFCAVDEDGQEWTLAGSKIVKGWKI